ncbi:MAG: SGNH/GDSL hydrolase family protein [Candidatus Limivicinus sp.]|jgi:acyl-CoA thioesterase-1
MKINVFGDSILEGVTLENGKYMRKKELMEQLEKKQGIEIINSSKFGSTIDKGFNKLRRKIEREGLGDYTVLEFGGNDCSYRWDEVAARPEEEHLCLTPPEKFREFCLEMTDMVRRAGSVPVWASLPPINSKAYLKHICRDGLDESAILRWLGDVEHIARWQRKYSEDVVSMAEEKGCLLLDLRSAFPKAAECLKRYLCADGIHPNTAGQQLIYEQALRTLQCV